MFSQRVYRKTNDFLTRERVKNLSCSSKTSINVRRFASVVVPLKNLFLPVSEAKYFVSRRKTSCGLGLNASVYNATCCVTSEASRGLARFASVLYEQFTPRSFVLAWGLTLSSSYAKRRLSAFERENINAGNVGTLCEIFFIHF